VANHPKGLFFEALIILAVLPTDFCLFHTHSKVSRRAKLIEVIFVVTG